MKKFCLFSLLAIASLNAATIQDANVSKQAQPAQPTAQTSMILKAARTLKNVAVNVQTMDPKKVTIQEVALPEPATNMMIGSALVGLFMVAKRRRKSA